MVHPSLRKVQLFMSLTASPDPNWCSPPLRDSPATDDPKKARTSRSTRAAVSPKGNQPPLQFFRHFLDSFRISKTVPCIRIQRWSVPQRAGKSGQACWQSDDRSSSHGGYDEHDEGKHGNDDTADADHGLDQRFLCWLCHQYVQCRPR